MKYVLLIAIVGFVLWLMKARGRVDRRSGEGPVRGPAPPPAAGAMKMLACAHCGVHLPQSDAVVDGSDRPYCSEAHRLAGPR